MRLLLFSVGVLLTLQTPPGHKITGTWRLIADQETDSAGNIIRQDTSVSGLLIYTPNGKMSVQVLWRERRQPVMTDGIMDHDGVSSGLGAGSNTWDLDQARAIIDTYDAYFGDYTVDWKEHVIAHTVSGNLRPEKAGTVYKRRFRINGDTLFLKSIDPAMRWQTAWARAGH